MDAYIPDQEKLQSYIDAAIAVGIDILLALLILIIGFKIARFMENRTRSLMGRSDKIDETVSAFLASLVRYAIIGITFIAVLDQFGVETTSLVAVLGAAGLAVGLALQGTLSNVASGVMLLIFRPFTIGQFVEVAGEAGTVKSITLFTTALDTPDNVRKIIPNSAVWGATVVNYNFHDTRRMDEIYGIGYGADIDKAMAVIHRLLDEDDRALKDPERHVSVISLGDSSVNIVVRVWCASGDYWGLKFDMLKKVKQAFDAESIDIPFPTRTVHTVTAD